ncbi:unnamed protein product [Closterium sp. NIES-65]|nr:unnamed protein product [Closterium sp. NIES-65]
MTGKSDKSKHENKAENKAKHENKAENKANQTGRAKQADAAAAAPIQGACVRFSLADMVAATSDWSPQLHLMRGSYSELFKGVDPRDGVTPWLLKRRLRCTDEFQAEVAEMGHKNHPHLVRLLGYCDEQDEQGRREQVAVYEFMTGGSIVDKFGPVLQYTCCAASASLASAKIAGFDSVASSAAVSEGERLVPTTGVRGYVDPHLLLSHEPSTTNDLYSLGVVMLELLSGRRSLTPRQTTAHTFRESVSVRCGSVRGGGASVRVSGALGWVAACKWSLVQLARAGLACTSMPASSRPSLGRILAELEIVRDDVAKELRKMEEEAEKQPGKLEEGNGGAAEDNMGQAHLDSWAGAGLPPPSDLSSSLPSQPPPPPPVVVPSSSALPLAPLLCQQVSVAEVINEMASKHHPHLVRLLGFCMDYDAAAEHMEQIAIYEFMPNGDLYQRMHAEATALICSTCFLPTPAHLPLVLFGIFFLPSTHSPFRPCPLLVPLPPSPPSFGVLMMELLACKHVVLLSEDGSHTNIKEWVEQQVERGNTAAVVNADLNAPHAMASKLVEMALSCVARLVSNRPSMSEVLVQLETLQREYMDRSCRSSREGLSPLPVSSKPVLVAILNSTPSLHTPTTFPPIAAPHVHPPTTRSYPPSTISPSPPVRSVRPVLGAMRLAEMRAVYAQLAPLMAGMILVAMGLCVALVSMLDVIVSALCPTDQCPEALMLSAGRATIGGIANIIVAPIFGGLSDKHGRKPFLLLGIAGITIPYAILATSSSRLAVYLFFAAETAGSALGGSAWLNLIYAYVADVTAEANRAAAFGAISGTTAFGFLAGPLVARFVPPAITFHVATLLCSCGWAYILIMVPESLPSHRLLRKAASLADEEHGGSAAAAAAAAVAAVDGVGPVSHPNAISFPPLPPPVSSALHDPYVFKAKFHWNKDDFSLYTAGIGLFAVLSQLLLLPLLLQILSLRSILILAISINSFHMVLYGLAWKPWVVYLALSMSLVSSLTQTSIGSMVSHLADPREQGKLQGVVSGMSSLSAVLAPLTINPITAYFMSDSAPIHQPGAGIIVAGIVEAVACVLVLALPPTAGKAGVRALTSPDSPTDCHSTAASPADEADADAQGNAEGGDKHVSSASSPSSM